MGLMDGKKGLILGVANRRSLGWQIAKACHEQGAELSFTYQSERLEKNLAELTTSIGCNNRMVCDVMVSGDIEKAAAKIKEQWGALDFVVHAIAFANREDLEGRYINTTRDNFNLALDVSAHSYVAVAKGFEDLLAVNGGSMVALTYLGGVRAVQHYNVMGVAKAALESSTRYLAVDLGPKKIRVNALSAGPVKTLAASGIAGFGKMLEVYEQRSALKRNVEPEEVGNAGMFLLSPLASGITGEVLYVDCGYNCVGL